MNAPAAAGGTGRFFCEGCGARVGRDAGRCPACGKVFASVLCPRCGLSGPADIFGGGCPACGYCAPAEAGAGKRQGPAAGSRAAPGKRPPATAAGGLPPWVYVCAAAGFAAAAALLLFALG